jgi:hypothetical protein
MRLSFESRLKDDGHSFFLVILGAAKRRFAATRTQPRRRG